MTALRDNSVGALLTLAAMTAAAYGCAPTLAGRLTDPAGRPVAAADARVNITSLTSPSAPADAEAPVVEVCPVDDGGRFEADTDLPDGAYLVEALVPGYALASETVTIGGQEANGGDRAGGLVLTLKPLATPAATAIGAKIKAAPGDDSSRGAGGATLMPPQL
jgi:hypothetical protein